MENNLINLHIYYVYTVTDIHYAQWKLKHKINKFIVLYIYIVPRTELVGDSDRYVKVGSTVVLRCIIRGALEPPSYIIWYHGTQQLLPESQRGIRMQMGKGAPDLDGDTHSTVCLNSVIFLWYNNFFF